MTQAFDMRRLHMGCGESLYRQLLPLRLIRLPKQASKRVIDQHGAKRVEKDKTPMDESR